MSQTQIKELKTQLKQLLDEYEGLNEELDRLPEDDPESDMIVSEMNLLEDTIGRIEEQLELLR